MTFAIREPDASHTPIFALICAPKVKETPMKTVRLSEADNVVTAKSPLEIGEDGDGNQVLIGGGDLRRDGTVGGR